MADAASVSATITAMGFTAAAARRAIDHVGCDDAERAIDWILANGDGAAGADDDGLVERVATADWGSDDDGLDDPPPVARKPSGDGSPLAALQRLEAVNAAWEADLEAAPELPEMTVRFSVTRSFTF